jgi:hypothetical protein
VGIPKNPEDDEGAPPNDVVGDGDTVLQGGTPGYTVGVERALGVEKSNVADCRDTVGGDGVPNMKLL